MTLFRKYVFDDQYVWEFSELKKTNSTDHSYKRIWHGGFKTRASAVMESAAQPDRVEMDLAHALTFSDVVELWLREYEKSVKGSTYLRTKSIFENHFLTRDMFGDRPLADIDVQFVQEKLEQLNSRVFKARRCVFYLSQIFKYASLYGLIKDNLVDHCIVPADKSAIAVNNEPKYWELAQLKKFMTIIKGEYLGTTDMIYVFFKVLAYTGLRKGELLALRWQDIDFATKEVHVQRTVSRNKDGKQIITSPKTLMSDRYLALDNGTLDVLRTYYHLVQPASNAELVIMNKFGEMLCMTTCDKWLHHIITKYDLTPISLHGFRHTFASIAFEAGLDVKQVQFQLGHTNINTTLEVYSHVTKKRKHDGIKKFSNYIS
ncbi:tyrosine-type recombinase/integrase [Periweissella cryptocerci]|nr:site-specific integrase [Periweissella cryptocerci]